MLCVLLFNFWKPNFQSQLWKGSIIPKKLMIRPIVTALILGIRFFKVFRRVAWFIGFCRKLHFQCSVNRKLNSYEAMMTNSLFFIGILIRCSYPTNKKSQKRISVSQFINFKLTLAKFRLLSVILKRFQNYTEKINILIRPGFSLKNPLKICIHPKSSALPI